MEKNTESIKCARCGVEGSSVTPLYCMNGFELICKECMTEEEFEEGGIAENCDMRSISPVFLRLINY